MTTTIQLTTGVLTGEVRDVANPATPITAGGFVTDTIPNRGPNDTILLSLEGESANSAASVVSTYGGLVFTPNAVDAPTLGTWTYYLNPTAAETIALGANPPPTTETFTITYITRDDNGSETGSYEATIVVTIAGKDDPVQSIRYVNPTDDTADISIDEDASTGDIVGEVVITDTDTEVDDSNGNSDVPAFTITAISYVDENGDTQSFTGESPFGFDEATGNIIVVGDLDYESINQYTLTITATDATDTSIVTPPVTVTINVRDVNEAPTLSASSVSGAINENVVAGTKVTGITFTAEDVDVGDNPTYHIIGGDGMSVFDIADDGTIILKDGATLDYENTNSYTLTAEARDPEGLKSDPVTVTIEIGNELEINNNVPFAPISINENDTSLSFTVTPVEAKFEDSPFPWITDPVKVGTVYSIDSGGDGLFTIGRTSGIVTLTGALDYETKEQYKVVVRADVGDEHATTTLTINVRDVYEAPTISVDEDTITIAENDADADLNTIFEVDGNIVTGLEEDDFTITGEHSENFRIAKNTNGEWQLELTSALDYEAVRDNADDTEADFDLQIAITDDRGNSATQTINVNVTDINDNAPDLAGIGLGASNRIVEQTATESAEVGYIFCFSDDDAGTVFTTDSFTFTGADGNVDDRFELLFDGTFWSMYLKAGKTLDYDNVAHRFIPLMLTVSDGVNVSEGISVYVKTVRGAKSTEGNDVIKGSSDPDDIYGHGGDDTIYAGAGNDYLWGGDNDDTLYGGAENDRLYGGSDTNTLYGGAENDQLYGGSDADTLYGNSGNDTLDGYAGNDTLYGGAGHDRLIGGRDNDLFYLDIANAKAGNINADFVHDFSRGGTYGIDRILIEVSKSDKAMIDDLTTDRAKLGKLIELADIRWEVAQHERILSSSWGDHLIRKNTAIYDTRDTTRTDDDILLMTLFDFSTNLTFDMFHIVVEDIITGTSSGETLSGTGRNSRIDGERGNDTIYGDAGDDIIRGDAGNDILYGGEDNDSLYGGGNTDFLHGEGGVDILYGNSGNDRFVLDIINAGAPDVDIVADFSRGGSLGHDCIRVDTLSGNEASFAALGLYVRHGTSKALTGHETDENHASTMDTVIYKIIGQADTASNRETDDVALMIIEDYTITDTDFATMVEVV